MDRTTCKKGKIYGLELDNCISICLKGEKYYEEIDLFKEKNIFFWNIKFFLKNYILNDIYNYQFLEIYMWENKYKLLLK